MNAKEYNKKSYELFNEWEKDDHCEHFIRDGIVNANEWFEQKTKICFLLKEAYTNEEHFCLNNWLNEDETCVKNTWKTVSLWVDGIFKTDETNIPVYAESNALDRKARHDLIKKIAAVNIKKSDGKKRSDWYNLAEYADRDKEKLKKQLEIINPDVIVCGSTYDFLRIIYGTKYDIEKKKVVNDTGEIPEDKTDKGYFITKDKKIIIKYYHPQNQFPSKVNFYAICCLYQQALKEKNNTK